jgi:hypothetical protein
MDGTLERSHQGESRYGFCGPSRTALELIRSVRRKRQSKNWQSTEKYQLNPTVRRRPSTQPDRGFPQHLKSNCFATRSSRSFSAIDLSRVMKGSPALSTLLRTRSVNSPSRSSRLRKARSGWLVLRGCRRKTIEDRYTAASCCRAIACAKSIMQTTAASANT